MKTKLNQKQRKSLFKEILKVQAPSGDEEEMRVFLRNFLNKNKLSYFEDSNNIYVTKGTGLRPCVVSHQDGVGKRQDYKMIFENKDMLFAFGPYGQMDISGDDQCGIFICCLALLDYDNIKVVFFSDEEVGYKGSKEAKLDFFDDCLFVAQPDRKGSLIGSQDFIKFTNGVDVCDKDFIERITPALELYDYKPCHGTGTDVGQLVIKGLKLNCFNFSAGYFNAHSATSYIKYSLVLKAYEFLQEVIDIVDTQVFRIDLPKAVTTYGSYNTYSAKIAGRDYQDTTEKGYQIQYHRDYYIGFNKGYDAGKEEAYNEEFEEDCLDKNNLSGNVAYCVSNFTKSEGGSWKCNKCSKQLENDDMQLLLDEVFLEALNEDEDGALLGSNWSQGQRENYF